MGGGNEICRFTRKSSGGDLRKVTSQNPPPGKLPSIPRVCIALPFAATGRARLVDGTARYRVRCNEHPNLETGMEGHHL